MGTLEHCTTAPGSNSPTGPAPRSPAYLRRPPPRAKRAGSSTSCGATSPTTPAEVRSRFDAYLDRFDVRIEVSMNVQEQVDHLIDTRGGKELLRPAYDDPAVASRERDLPLRRDHRRLPAADRRRPGHRQHGPGLRGPAPQAHLRRCSARTDPLHRDDAGPRRPRRRRGPVQGHEHRLCRTGQQSGVPSRRRTDPSPAYANGRHLVRHVGQRRPSHCGGEPRRADASGRTSP